MEKVKEMVYRTTIRPIMLYGNNECMDLEGQHDNKLRAVEMSTLGWMCKHIVGFTMILYDKESMHPLLRIKLLTIICNAQRRGH